MKKPRNAGAAGAGMLETILQEITAFLVWLFTLILVAALLVEVFR